MCDGCIGDFEEHCLVFSVAQAGPGTQTFEILGGALKYLSLNFDDLFVVLMSRSRSKRSVLWFCAIGQYTWPRIFDGEPIYCRKHILTISNSQMAMCSDLRRKTL